MKLKGAGGIIPPARVFGENAGHQSGKGENRMCYKMLHDLV
jgi:hypothetical protein